MTRVFAITGRQRHSLPHIERRSYIHALETILEDSSTTDMLKTYNADYTFMVETYAGSYGQLADRHAMSYHNYDEILTENMDPMPRFPERQYSSDDITKGRIQISGILRKNQPSTILKTSKLQVPDHAEERKFKSTLPKPKPSGELNIDHKHSKCAVDVHRDVADCDSLDNGLVEALNNDRFIHVGSNSIYYVSANV
ncbi:hypothetical protein DPMN_011410 [Dreissena polymorpha]|uniref:Uncharacterized protein n=1 Tax=Dreissena polymorpha TaxID=45954 RepID=A0A9D4N3W6_DREPO|nr:hypothetical protein DPMN_011410 [Dreissena polymorpha]